MIIFGWGRRTRKDNGQVVLVTCSRCNNPVAYRWISVKTWFSLFFIPVIPYSSKHFLVCPTCSNARPITKADTEHFAGMMALTAHALTGDGDSDAYGRSAENFWKQLAGAAPPDAIAAQESTG